MIVVAIAALLGWAGTTVGFLLYLRDRDVRDRAERRELAERIQRPELVPPLVQPDLIPGPTHLSEDEEDALYLARNLASFEVDE